MTSVWRAESRAGGEHEQPGPRHILHLLTDALYPLEPIRDGIVDRYEKSADDVWSASRSDAVPSVCCPIGMSCLVCLQGEFAERRKFYTEYVHF